jgi:hypothetical protein
MMVFTDPSDPNFAIAAIVVLAGPPVAAPILIFGQTQTASAHRLEGSAAKIQLEIRTSFTGGAHVNGVWVYCSPTDN